MCSCCDYGVFLHTLFVLFYTVLGLFGLYCVCRKTQCSLVSGCCVVKVAPWALLLGVLSCVLVLLLCCF